jgi:hypothetical protein
LLETTIGRFGERGAIDLEKIVVTPEAMSATQKYLGRSFMDYVDPNATGQANPVKAQRWMRTNEAILDKFPRLKAQLSDAKKAQAFADDMQIKMDTRKKNLRNPKVGYAAKYLKEENLQKKISDIFQSTHPSRYASEMVRQAGKDQTGDALAGLQHGVMEHILTKSTNGPFNAQGQQSLSGRAILNFIKREESTISAVFNKKKFVRMKQIASELSKVEIFNKVKGSAEMEMSDFASKLLAIGGRLVGAEIGGRTGGATMGGSLQHASIVSGNAQKLINYGSKHTAQSMVQDAILSEDPALIQSLLKVIKKPNLSKAELLVINKNLNAWLGSSGARVMEDIERDRQE